MSAEEDLGGSPDVLGSDVERTRSARRPGMPRARPPRLGPRARIAVLTLLGVAALVAVVILRSTAPAPEGRGAAVAPTPKPGFPYDDIPGRTPIPPPTHVPQSLGVVGGPLPRTGPEPGAGSALSAVDLVLGHYCAHGGDGGRTITPISGWRAVQVSVTPRASPVPAQPIMITLNWTGTSYHWMAEDADLRTCP